MLQTSQTGQAGGEICGAVQLRLLVVEDSALDAELAIAELQQAGLSCRWDRVETRGDFLLRLESSQYDLVLADYSLPSFDGLTALQLVRERWPDLPVILMSGVLGEEQAVESLKAGAVDYVMKSRLTRLAPVVQRALRERDASRQRQRLEAALARRTAELEAANRDLEAFTSAASHDLRNPLAVIIGYADLLAQTHGGQLDSRGRDTLERILAVAYHMTELIDDLLRLARAGRSDLSYQAVDLSAAARTIAAELQQQSDRRVEFVIAPGLVARGDPALLRVALENLLGNAWKYTQRQMTAHIEFGQVPTSASMEAWGPPHETVYFVRDDGVGFDMARAGELFKPFHRLHSAAEFEGNGVGLATVRRIIQRHGGRVWAESAVGKGATFYFSLTAANGT